VSVCQKSTTRAWPPLTVLGRTCRTDCYTHSVRRMPTCTCARKNFAQVRLVVDFVFFYVTLLLAFAHCCSEYYFNLILVIYFASNEYFYRDCSNWCAVISDGSGWGCNSEYGENIMNACHSESFPANMTGVSTTDSCRQVM